MHDAAEQRRSEDSRVLAAVAHAPAWPELADALARWVPAQRWFQGKARAATATRVADAVLLRGQRPVLDVLLEVTYEGGGSERYQVPLVAGVLAGGQQPVGRACGVALGDALTDPPACRALAALALAHVGEATAGGGVVRGEPVAGHGGLAEGTARPMGVEQTNSSVVIGDAVLKVFRKLEDGANPDVELTRALTEAGFAHVPAQRGSVVLGSGGTETTLAVVSEFAGGAEEGWALACREAAAVEGGAPGETFVARIGELGRVTGELHATLRDALGGGPTGPETAARWAQEMQQQAVEVLALAHRRAAATAAPVIEAAGEVQKRLGAVALLEDAGPRIRVHGDFHLGQVLWQRDRWLVLDFEGEPARPLPERRQPQSPLRDVAGMLRSFDYAAAQVHTDVPPGLAAWRDGLRAAFVDGYLAVARPAGLVPDSRVAQVLLDAFELDKAIYELGYELANRPEWIGIPLGGILRLLDGRD